MFYCCLLFIIVFIARSPRSVGQSQRNFATCSEAGSVYKCWSKNLGPASWKKFRSKKQAKFGSISDPFPLWVQISPEWIEISKIWKLGALQHCLPHWAKKVRWTFIHKPRRFRGGIVPQKSTFLEERVSAPKGCCALKFLHMPYNVQVLLAHIPQGMWVAPTILFQWGIKNWLKI